MPAQLTRTSPQRFTPASAATDTPFLTVMLDVTANLLCTAVILLVLGLAMDRRTEPVIEEVAVTTAPTLAPAGVIAAFLARTVQATDTVTIDLDRAGVTIKPVNSAPDRSLRLSWNDVADGKLAVLLDESPKAGVLLFIFDQAGYGAARAVIDKSGLASREVDVPLALRSATDPQRWSRGFQSLYGLDLDAEAFQNRLRQILVGQGAAENSDDDGAVSSATGGMSVRIGNILEVLGFWWRLLLVGAALLFFIRLRLR